MKNSTNNQTGKANSTPNESGFSPHKYNPVLDESLDQKTYDGFEFGFAGKPIDPVEQEFKAECDIYEAIDRQHNKSVLKSAQLSLKQKTQNLKSTTLKDKTKRFEDDLKPDCIEDVSELKANEAALKQEEAETIAQIGDAENWLERNKVLIKDLSGKLIAFASVIVIGAAIFEGLSIADLFSSKMHFVKFEAYILGFFLAILILTSADSFVKWFEKGKRLYASLALFTGISIIVTNLLVRIYYGEITGIYISIGMIAAYISEILALHYLEIGREARIKTKLLRALKERLKDIKSQLKRIEGAILERYAQLTSDSKTEAEEWFDQVSDELISHEEKITNAKEKDTQIKKSYKNIKESGLSRIQTSYQKGVKAREEIELETSSTNGSHKS